MSSCAHSVGSLRPRPQTTSTSVRARATVRPSASSSRSTGICSCAHDDVTPVPKGWRAALAALAAPALLTAALTVGVAEPVHARARLSTEESKVVDLFAKNTSGVVNITNLSSRPDSWSSTGTDYPQGAGSGIVWDRDGHVVTNYHVIRGASSVQVTLDGGSEYMANVIGQDEDKDVAVLYIEDKTNDLKPLTLGSSSDVLVGQRVYAIGNPFGLDHTLTTGIVSGIGREIQSGITGRPIQDAIQTDAAINPGNSGGPLLDSEGALIGINTAIYSANGGNSGVGFAIPVDTVRASVTEIISTGRVVRPVLGISFAPEQSTSQLGVNGILVLGVREDGPAAKAGVKGTSRDSEGRLILGDIIVSANSKPVKTATDLYRALDKCKVGQAIDLELLRPDSKEHLSIMLEAAPPAKIPLAIIIK